MRMTNGTELSLAIASCVDEQLSWCTLPLAVTGGDIATLLWDDEVTPGVIVAVVVVAVIAVDIGGVPLVIPLRLRIGV